MTMWIGAHSFRPVRLALESRLMLDAAALPAVVAEAAGDGDGKAATASDAAPARHAIVFAFSDVADWQSIAAAAPAGTRVERIDADADGLARMADVLGGLSGIDAVHVIGHGNDQGLEMGSASLTAATIADHAEALRTIGAALSADADILFYGCDAGSGGSGADLARALAAATGADIALSSDPTGAAGQGGDWDLETVAGTVETAALAAPGWDGLLQTTTTVDVASGGGEANGAAGAAALSSDGRYVAFTSAATNLVAGDTNGVTDVFVRDTQTGTVIRVSVNGAGTQGNGASTVSDISDDGRYVVFASVATNLVAGDTNGVSDVFRYDTQTGNTIRVSVNGGGNQANGASTGGSISADGNLVVFTSAATNLVGPNDTNNKDDVFLRKITGGATTMRVSSAAMDADGNGIASAGVISSDGSTVAFVSTSSNLVAGDTNGVADVFAFTVANLSTARVSVDNAGGQSGAASAAPSISTTGRFVAFSTSAALDGADTNGVSDIYLRDVVAAATSLISRTSGGAAGNGASSAPSISGGGDYVAFVSAASDLVSGDGNGAADIFVRDIAKSQTLRVSVASTSGAEANGASDNPALSSDGGQVAFRSQATNLAGSDTNGAADIFLASGFTVTPTDRGQGRNIMNQPRPGAEGAPPPKGLPVGEPPPPPSPLGPPGSGPGGVLGLGDGGTRAAPPIGLAGGGAERGGAGEAILRLSPVERMGVFGREGLSLAERRGLLQGLPAGTVIDALRASGDPAARAAAAMMERIQSGETVTVAEAKEALAAEGASEEAAMGLLLAISHVEKSARTERLAGALSELARDAAAADAFAKVAAAPVRDIALSGNRVAILIGVQNYQGGLPSLATPTADVNAVSRVLSDRFGYQTIVANDAGKAEIVELIRSVGERLDAQGSMIVYYAGHGYAVEATGEGYWLPGGARTDSAAGWISTRDVSNYLSQVKAGQIMVVSDSCYSGSLTRQMRLSSDAVGEPREQVVSRRSVTALSSGGDEPVNDGGGDGHSIFASKLLGALDQAPADSMGFQLFSQVRAEVTRSVPQEPTYGGLSAAGHAGKTDFVIGGR